MAKECADAIEKLQAENTKLSAELERYQHWVNDLQSGMYVNCVYCGHRYGPEDEVPASMADVLKEHIEHCPEHPMSKLRTELEQVKAERDAAVEALCGNCAYCIKESVCLSRQGSHKNCWRWRGFMAGDTG